MENKNVIIENEDLEDEIQDTWGKEDDDDIAFDEDTFDEQVLRGNVLELEFFDSEVFDDEDDEWP